MKERREAHLGWFEKASQCAILGVVGDKGEPHATTH